MKKDPVLAVILSVLIPGIGHIYLEQIGKGLVILIAAVLLGMIFWGIGYILVLLWSCFDVYHTAKTLNEEKV